MRCSNLQITIAGSMDSGGGTCLMITDGRSSPIVVDCGATPGNKRRASFTGRIVQAVVAAQPEILVPTHFHHDHKGAIPDVFAEMDKQGVPYPAIISSDMTFSLLKRHIPPFDSCGRPVRHAGGTGQVTLVFSKHSVPGSTAVLFEGSKNVFYTSDFYGIDLPESFPKIDLLVVNSTGAMKDEPRADKEEQARGNIWSLISETLRGNRSSRVYVALFSTHLERAAYLQRETLRVTCTHPVIRGASLFNNLLAFGGIRRSAFKSRVALVTGVWAQGESSWFREDASALVRIANGEDWECQLNEGDLVILSGSIPTWSSTLPPPIKAMCKKLRARGARVVVDTSAPESWAEFAERREVHTGGHGNMPEIAELIGKVKPRMVFPFHASPEARAKVAEWCRRQRISVVPEERVITL